MPPDLTIPVRLHGFPTDPQDPADPRLQPIPGDGWLPDEKRRYGIQFVHALSEEEGQEIIAAYGLALAAYVPKFTYIELVDLPTLSAVAQEPLVNGVFPFVAVYKMSPTIGLDPPDGQGGLHLRIALFSEPDVDPEAVAQFLAGLGAQNIQVNDLRPRSGLARIECLLPDPTRVPEIAELPQVSWIEEVTQAVPDSADHLGLLETGTAANAPLFGTGLNGAGQIVGVIDGGGLTVDHCWFAGPHPNQPGSRHRKVVADRNATKAGHSIHPNFVCGVLAGDATGSACTAFDRGIACGARISYSNRKDFENNSAAWSMFGFLLDARADGAFIHNNSWHYRDNPDYSVIAYDVDRFTRESEDCLVVASSGNRKESIGPPGSAKNALCVSAAYVGGGASCVVDGADGPTFDRRRRPEILAPGSSHVSAGSSSRCTTQSDQSAGAKKALSSSCAPANTYCAASFATPVVSAAAAIVRQYFTEGWYPSGAATPADARTPSGALLKAMLLNATAATTSGFGHPNDKEGWGLLQLDRVLPLANGASRLWFEDRRHASGLTRSRAHAYVVMVRPRQNPEPLTVTLVWSDPPAEVYSNLDPVVNNLDLEVTDPNGIIYRGNHFAGGVSVAGGAAANADERNNVEMVLVPNPLAGAWTVTVRATEVNSIGRRQGYALVATGDL